jgi:hypothetical protein
MQQSSIVVVIEDNNQNILFIFTFSFLSFGSLQSSEEVRISDFLAKIFYFFFLIEK